MPLSDAAHSQMLSKADESNNSNRPAGWHVEIRDATVEVWANGEATLGLSTAVNSQKSPPEALETRDRKAKPQTSYSKRIVRNGAFVLQKQAGRNNLAFATLTLPQAAVEILESRGSDAPKLYAECDRQMKQWIGNQLERKHINSWIVSCVEVQTERFKQTGQVALHSHYVFQGKLAKGNWVIHKDKFRNHWNKILSNVLGEKIESLASTRIERVRKSAEYYLSKYMSKSGDVVNEIEKAGKKHMLPSCWFGCSIELREKIKSMSTFIPKEVAQAIYRQREELKSKGILSYFHVHEIESVQSHGEPFMLPVAFIFKFRDPEYVQMSS
jgi:hypothetical protein